VQLIRERNSNKPQTALHVSVIGYIYSDSQL